VRASADALKDSGWSAEAVVLDITREKAVARAIAALMKRHGRVDVLINNAGISPKHAGLKLPAERTPLAEWQRVLDINLTGAFLMSRAVIPCMRAGCWGRIVNMASQAGRTGSGMAGAHYSASKAGLIGFSRTLALEVAGEGITVNCIAPGMVESELTAVQPAAVRRRYASRMPMRRYAKPAEIAAAAAFLASDEARFITGATIDVNGGTFTG
jgi:3-oxoacyl-[acyl-carrier protein] reductase